MGPDRGGEAGAADGFSGEPRSMISSMSSGAKLSSFGGSMPLWRFRDVRKKFGESESFCLIFVWFKKLASRWRKHRLTMLFLTTAVHDSEPTEPGNEPSPIICHPPSLATSLSHHHCCLQPQNSVVYDHVEAPFITIHRHPSPFITIHHHSPPFILIHHQFHQQIHHHRHQFHPSNQLPSFGGRWGSRSGGSILSIHFGDSPGHYQY